MRYIHGVTSPVASLALCIGLPPPDSLLVTTLCIPNILSPDRGAAYLPAVSVAAVAACAEDHGGTASSTEELAVALDCLATHFPLLWPSWRGPRSRWRLSLHDPLCTDSTSMREGWY